jgi:hypothetical protein
VGEPSAVSWWALGRPATRTEAEAALASGLPLLEEAADADGDAARRGLAEQVAVARTLLPVGAGSAPAQQPVQA